MSLFKGCTWWATQCPDFEPNYDSYSLHCCRFGLENGEKDCIVVGSHAGYLNIFQPTQTDETANTTNDFKPTDLLLEIKLPSPILQVTSGTFLIGSDQEGKRQLAVLHPMKLSVYSLNTIEGNAEHGKQSKLNICFEHKFTKHAFSVCKGNFGGYKSREFFCITHLDGTLTFYEQDGITFACTLNADRNIPPIMAYNSRTDSFVLVSSDGELECYRYQDLGQANEHKDMAVLPTWSICIGEYALDINVQQTANLECLIVVLGEHNIYCISDTAVVKFIKRLDYTPLCFCTFVAGWYWEPNAKLIVTVITDSGTLLLYDESNLKWAAQLSDVPIAVNRSNLDGLPGAVVTLGRTGNLIASYLGSEPLVFKVPPLNLKALDFDNTQKELIELEKDIKAGIDFTDMSLINNAAEHDLSVQLVIGSKLVPFPLHNVNRGRSTDHETQNMCSVSVGLKASVPLEQIQVQFFVEAPLKCLQTVQSYEGIGADSIEQFDTHVYFGNGLPAPSAKVMVVVSFINKKCIPRIIRKVDYLPLDMFCKLDSPQKDALNKVTISVENSEVPTLEGLFTEYTGDLTSLGAVGFKIINSESIVTVVSAKNSNRFRIQSDDLKAIAVILEIILVRIDKKKKLNKEQKLNQSRNAPVDKVKIWIHPQLQVDTVIDLVMSHHTAKEEVKKIRKDLESSTTQMRLLERRLFAKLDDKKANALHRVSSFLKLTHQQILVTLRNLENANTELTRAQINLSCGLAVTRLCVSHFDLPSKTTEGIRAALVTPVQDYLEQSWEELSSASFDALNCIGPLRKANSTVDDLTQFSVSVFEIDRFKRHIKGLLDRACRFAAKAPTDPTRALEDEENDNGTILEGPIEEESDWVSNEKKPVENLGLHLN